VQVRSGAPARAAGGADPLAGLDLVANVNAPTGEVRVQRRVAPADGDLDDVAVALVPSTLPDGNHAAALGCPHR
jgi:hypothetical protein